MPKTAFMVITLLLLLLLETDFTRAALKKNVVLVLTDNQDLVLGGLTPMRHTNRLIAEKGVSFSNAFVTTPVCCPSRATLLTGRYPHNTGTVTNLASGHCDTAEWRSGPEQSTYATWLQSSGYTTAFVGKYLNRYGLAEEGGPSRVPPGWTHWAGLVGNSVYYNYTLSVDGEPEEHGNSYQHDYLTDVIKNKALRFLDNRNSSSDPSPFLLVLSTSAPHDPETPAPQYQRHFLKEKAPRTPAYNYDPQDSKHWVTRMSPQKLGDAQQHLLDEKFRKKWRALLSVDDMVEEVVDKLEKQNLLEDTYIMFTSDHGYHLGQFGMPFDMRQPYDTDIRVPLLIRGPGLHVNYSVPDTVLSIDLAPTIVDLAGIDVQDQAQFDGESFKPGKGKCA